MIRSPAENRRVQIVNVVPVMPLRPFRARGNIQNRRMRLGGGP
jgi:hypothetical protein